MRCDLCGEQHVATLDLYDPESTGQQLTVAYRLLNDRISSGSRLLCANCHRKLRFRLRGEIAVDQAVFSTISQMRLLDVLDPPD